MQNGKIQGNARQPPTLVSFNGKVSQLTWQLLGDRVTGGQSDGAVVRAEGGTGIFHGIVVLF